MRVAAVLLGCAAISCLLASCNRSVNAKEKQAELPPARIQHVQDGSVFALDHPERFPVTTAESYDTAPAIQSTGVISADVSRTIPVVSLSPGRVVEVRARLGDRVSQGQLLARIQSADIGQAFSDYRQALADEALARAQYERSLALFDRGAVAAKDLEVARDAAEKAKVTVETTRARLQILGVDPNNPSTTVAVYAPASGVITEQNITAAAGVKSLDNSPNLFTIADLSHVWILCDAYENQLPNLQIGEIAEVRVSGYPNTVLKARIGDISPIIDSNTRTAKVRLEVANPGMLRIGMFVTATFHSGHKELHAKVPATAVLHLHDRDWVYVPEGKGVRRAEVTAGDMLEGNTQEIVAGLRPGDGVIANALVLQNTIEQK